MWLVYYDYDCYFDWILNFLYCYYFVQIQTGYIISEHGDLKSARLVMSFSNNGDLRNSRLFTTFSKHRDLINPRFVMSFS